MNFQTRDLPTHLDTWLTVMREQVNNTNNPRLKHLFGVEVQVLEQLIHSFKVGDYKLVDVTQAKAVDLMDAVDMAFVNINRDFGKFGGVPVVENPLLDAFNFATGHKDALNVSAQDRRFNECESKLIPIDDQFSQVVFRPHLLGIDIAAPGTDKTVVCKIDFDDVAKLKRTVVPLDQFFKHNPSPTTIRERIADLTKLPVIQVRIVMAQMHDEPLRTVVFECLRRYGLSIAGKGESVDQAATYYAAYHIDRVMKELGQ